MGSRLSFILPFDFAIRENWYSFFNLFGYNTNCASISLNLRFVNKNSIFKKKDILILRKLLVFFNLGTFSQL